MQAPDQEKQLRFVSFVAHATRGVLRERRFRRWAMMLTVAGALVMILLGTTVLEPVLDPKLHPFWFIFFWLACAWLTVTALLLGLLDLLLTRVAARASQQLQRNIVEEEITRKRDEGEDAV